MGAGICCEEESSEDDSHGSDETPDRIHTIDPAPVPNRRKSGDPVTVLNRYLMGMSDKEILGEGTSSICRSGTDTHTGQRVAVKVYKKHRCEKAGVSLKKFKRQISVLKELQLPLIRPSDPRLWDEALANAAPASLFMQLIDYSKDKHGNPCPDPTDGVMYVVTEVGAHSLKDYLKDRRDKHQYMSPPTVQQIARQLILVVAALHAKGLVHLDIKPDNLMIFNGVLKLIDVDGCVKIGQEVSIEDSSLSFSPCYCAPEWAAFVCDDCDDATHTISPALDVWSVAMTIGEMVTLDAVLRTTYASFLKHGRAQQDAGLLFLEWLSGRHSIDLPPKIRQFDQELADLLSQWFFVTQRRRKTLAEALQHPYVESAQLARSSTSPLVHPVTRVARQPRAEDHSSKVFHQGLMWKLNRDGNVCDPNHWLKREMWITVEGNLGYFSQKECKRLILIDGHRLAHGQVRQLAGTPFQYAFQIRCPHEEDDDHEHRDGDFVLFHFACESAQDVDQWVRQLQGVQQQVGLPTIKLGNAKDFRALRQNRRQHVQPSGAEKSLGVSRFEPVFKGKLWKVIADGDHRKPEDWRERDMWISKNGCLVYYSMREGMQLVYYADQDMQRATVRRFKHGEAAYPWSFQVRLSALDGVDFAPGEFAAETQDLRERWLQAFKGSGATIVG